MYSPMVLCDFPFHHPFISRTSEAHSLYQLLIKDYDANIENLKQDSEGKMNDGHKD